MAQASRRNVQELTAGEQLDQVFMISQPVLRTTTRGDLYIAAFLSDRTGKCNSRMWQASEEIFRSLPEEGFVRIKGHTETYQGAIQVVLEAIRPVGVEDVELEDFMPATQKDIGEMFGRVIEILATIKNPHLVRLVKAFLEDTPLMDMFCQAPAAAVLHHAYIGGLLEHTLSVLELTQRVLQQYPELDRDLMLTGVFLHDMGKTTELDFDLSFKYSDQGRLVGHIVKGTLLIQKKIDQLGGQGGEPFPGLLVDMLEHIVVSHHGVREFGCPVLPATPEAFAVHYLDNLDSKMALTFQEIKNDPSRGSWTSYNRALETCLLKVRP